MSKGAFGVAKKKKNPTEIYQLVCKECGARNYVLRLKKENKSLALKKYCPTERKHMDHAAKKV